MTRTQYKSFVKRNYNRYMQSNRTRGIYVYVKKNKRWWGKKHIYF